MPPGLNKFAFKGQRFGKAGETPAIDFDLYSLFPGRPGVLPRQLGPQCSNGSHGDSVFRQANGPPYELGQHILHIKANAAGPYLQPHRQSVGPAISKLIQRDTMS